MIELTQGLRAALQAAADESSSLYREARARSEAAPEDFRRSLFLHFLSEAVTAELDIRPPFGPGKGFMVCKDNGASGFYAQNAAFALIDRFASCRDADASVAWLDSLLQRQSASGQGIMALRGVTVTEKVQLSPDIALVPLSELPDSRTKAAILTRHHDLTASLIAGMWDVPACALTMPAVISPVFYAYPTATPPVQTDPHRFQTALDEARRALSLIGPSAPLNAGYWFQYDDPDLDRLSHSGLMGTMIEVMPTRFGGDIALTGPPSIEVVSAYLALGGSLRDKTRLALDRLNQAVRRRPSGDKAIDLCIAFEVLVVDGPGENTHKVGLRAALAIGGSRAERVVHRAIVGALYTIRSAVAHSGSLPSDVRVHGRGKVKSAKVIEEAEVVLAQLIRALMQRRIPPQWYELEVGGE